MLAELASLAATGGAGRAFASPPAPHISLLLNNLLCGRSQVYTALKVHERLEALGLDDPMGWEATALRHALAAADEAIAAYRPRNATEVRRLAIHAQAA